MSNVAIRVLLVLENAGAGSGRHVIDLANGLLARGHEVTLLFSRSRLEGWFEREMRNTKGLRSATLSMRPGLGLADVATFLAVRRYIADHGPFDVVHGHSSKGGAVARIGALKLPGVRVYTPHAFYTLGARPGSLRSRFYATLERVLARACAGIICVSQAEHRHALSLGLPAAKLFTVPNGLDALPEGDRAAARRQLELTDEQVCVGFVGRLARQKAVHRLIDAFAVVHARHSAARLVIVGDGPDSDALKSRAQSRGIEHAVVWTGAANGVEMMRAFDIFVLPSLYEAFPYVLLEALGSALAIVSMRVGGVDELVHEKINGFVIEQNNPDALAERLEQLIADPALRGEMGVASSRIVKDFDIAAMVTGTIDVYRQLLNKTT